MMQYLKTVSGERERGVCVCGGGVVHFFLVLNEDSYKVIEPECSAG